MITQEDRERLHKRIHNGDLFDFSDEELKQALRIINALAPDTRRVQIRDIVRSVTINHIQMARVISDLRVTITRLNEENETVANRVLILTVIAVICGLIQAFGVFWTIHHSP